MLTEITKNIIRNNAELSGMAAVVEKEILHLDILYLLAREGYLERLTFIGGTALRLCYHSSRLSEDLDFTGGCHFKPDDFSGLGVRLQCYLQEKYQVPVTATEPAPKEGDTSTWKITLETRGKRVDLPAQKIHIDICAYDSLAPTARPVYSHYGVAARLGGMPIPVQSLEEILADKMIALALRGQRMKPRDIWDIVWLRQENVRQAPDMVLKKLEMRSVPLDVFRVALQAKADMLIPDNQPVRRDFTNEMTRFLPASIRATSLDQPGFFEYICNTVVAECTQLEGYLNGSISAPDRAGFRM